MTLLKDWVNMKYKTKYDYVEFKNQIERNMDLIHLFIDMYCYNILTESGKFHLLLNYILYQQRATYDLYFYENCESDDNIIIDIVDDNMIIEFIDDVITIERIDTNKVIIVFCSLFF